MWNTPTVRKGLLFRFVIPIALMLRLFSALYQGNEIGPLPGVSDQESYDSLARQVLDGQGFTFPSDWWPATRAGEPTAHWSFLYTLYLVGLYAVSDGNVLTARLIQAVAAGILQPWLTWRIGNRVFGPRVGMVAASGSAVYAYFVFYAGSLMTETFYILAILWTFDLLLTIQKRGLNGDTPGWRVWVLFGLAVGTTILLRQVFILLLPLMLGWLVFLVFAGDRSSAARARWKKSLTGPLMVLAVVASLIAPWTIRNYQSFDRLLLLNTSAGFAFFWGNHPIHGNNFISILPFSGPSYQDLIPAELREFNEAKLERSLLLRGMGFVVEDPVRYLILSISRLKDYFKFWPSPDSAHVSNLARVLSFGVFLPFMLAGLAISLRSCFGSRRYSREQRFALFPIYLFICLYSAIHLLSWALIRYRLPVDAFLLIFASVAFVKMAESFTLAGWTRSRQPLGTQ